MVTEPRRKRDAVPILLLVVECLALLVAVAGVWMLSPPFALITFGLTAMIICERFSATMGRKK